MDLDGNGVAELLVGQDGWFKHMYSLAGDSTIALIDANVLDLFSGTGALGIESLSRGAKKVDFVDNNIEAIKIIKQNLQGIDAEFSVNKSDYMSYLNEAKQQGKKYDIVLLDPPFNTDFGLKAIEYILTNDLLSSEGVIMYEKAHTTPFDLNIKGYIATTKKYGTVSVVKIVKTK